MVFDVLSEYPMVEGLLFAVAGVGFWIGGFLFVNWLWKRYRGEEPVSEG
jgi:hypothetical protein